MAKKTAVVATTSAGETIPALVISPGKVPVVGGNFDALEAHLVAVRDKYREIDIKKTPIDDVLVIKKQFQSFRTYIEKEEKRVNTDFFNNPKKILAGHFARLYALAAEIENQCDEVIEKEDAKRIEQINMAIDAYVAEFTADTVLTQKFLAQIERKKMYYNKTQDEADTRNDILAQVTALAKAQKAEEAGLRMIKKACDVSPLLNLDLYESMFLNGDDIASVLEAIEQEAKRLNNVQTTTEAGENGTPVVVSREAEETEETETEAQAFVEDADDIDFDSDLPSRTKTITIKLTYPADVAGALTQLFEMLSKKGVHSEVVG